MPRDWLEWTICVGVVAFIAVAYSIEWADRRREKRQRGFEVTSTQRDSSE